MSAKQATRGAAAPLWTDAEDTIVREFKRSPEQARRALIVRIGNPHRRTLAAVKRRLDNLRAAQLDGDAVATRWDRLEWGVLFKGSPMDDEPMLIGGLWAADLGGEPYPGEPTRALLFCTRKQARAWCAETLRKWADGRQRDDIVRRWRVRPVRVRETVKVEAHNASLNGARDGA